MRSLARQFFVALILFCAGAALAAEVMPPAPAKYFNDYANVASATTADNLNRTLEDFERATSSQILVAIYPTMQSDSSIEDYTVRVAQSWHVGQKGKDNGAVLFIFVQDHKMFIQVGYGLEGALPDVICKRIVSDEIAPRFKAGDYDGGLTAGVNAILAATKGEYKGNGSTVADASQHSGNGGSIIPFLFIAGIFILFFLMSLHRGTVYQSNGMSSVLGGIIGGLLSNSGRGGGGWSGGSSSGGSWGGGGGGGGFSGGGGSFGGGGAGGSW